MRLIDADELKKVFEDLANDGWNKATGTSWSRAFEESADIIDGCKTIEERKRGRWIDLGKDKVIRWQCPECGRKDTHIYNYCPDCGTDMRGEQE